MPPAGPGDPVAYGVNDRFDFTSPVPAAAELGQVHVLAIGGSGMSGVAALLHDVGVSVSGCDGASSAVTDRLSAAGIPVARGHDPAHLDGVDTVVVSSAIRESVPELQAARVNGIRVLHRAQALAASMGSDTRVAVAGANGKTTTSAMTVAALRGAGVDPSYVIGSELIESARNFARGADPIFVAEADESDGSFLSYRPQLAVVTNVQPDHLDFYGDLAHVEAAYDAFAASVTEGGLLVAAHDDPGALALAARVRAAGGRAVTYGEHPDAQVCLHDAHLAGMRSSATVEFEGRQVALAVPAPGRHNLHNATAALAAGWLGLQLDPEALAAGLASFAGTRRRFENRGQARGVTVVDDYAHNAPKVAALVAGARGAVAPGGVLRVVFQPHLYSRTRDFAEGFAAGLAPADQIVLLPVYGAREDPIPGVGSELIAEHLHRMGRPVEVADSPADAVHRLANSARSGDLILTVGAGDVTLLGPQLLIALTEEF